MRLVLCCVFFYFWLGNVESAGGKGLIRYYLGCFPISWLNKTAPHVQYPFNMDNCFKLCSGLGKRYAGIAKPKNYCYCDDEPPKSHSEEDSNCAPCPDNPARSCGGDAHASLYVLRLPRDNTTDDYPMSVLMAREVEGQASVEFLNITEGNYEIIARPNYTVTLIDYHYSKNWAFGAWDQEIFRFPLNGTLRTPLPIISGVLCEAFAVDWLHDHIFYSDCGFNNDIMMTDLDGSNPATLVKIQPYLGWVFDMAVDPYKGLLFWITQEELMSCELDGRRAKTFSVKKHAEEIQSLVLDMRSERVYINGLVSGSAIIFYKDYNGSDYHILKSFTHDQPEVWIIGVFKSQLYFMRRVINHGFYFFKGPILANTLQQQDPFGDQGFLITDTINHMKIVDPEMQSPGRVDACTKRGCSHHCLLESSVARCRCPRKFTLSSDDKTCEKDWDSILLYYVLGGIACVLSVLMGAGVLMCLVDKLWTKAHPSVVRISESNIFRRSTNNRQTLDSDQLIY